VNLNGKDLGVKIWSTSQVSRMA